MNIGKEFVEKTKYPYLQESAQRQGIPQPTIEEPLPANVQLIDLPDPQKLELVNSNFLELLAQRQTVRDYAVKEISLQELSLLLWATQGVREVTNFPVTKRIVPSAGSRHAFETYLLINQVAGLQSGCYRYVALQHKLYRLSAPENISQILTDACGGQKQVLQSAVTFFWAAVPFRMSWRYSERAYRYLYLDAGHVCQNLYLAAEAIQCGVCAIAAYDDDAVDKALGLDGQEIFTIYIASLGKKK